MKTSNSLISLGLVFLMMFCMAFACGKGDESGGGATDGETTPQTTETTQQSETAQTGVGKPYGARDPRTCADTKAPTKGAISAAQATPYVICSREGVSGDYLFLVDNVKVTVGGSRPYNSKSDSISDIDVTAPIYPIRGTYDSYLCSRVSHNSEDAGKNCSLNRKLKADGICYKTTFGDWHCDMAGSSNRYDTESNLPPPK